MASCVLIVRGSSTGGASVVVASCASVSETTGSATVTGFVLSGVLHPARMTKISSDKHKILCAMSSLTSRSAWLARMPRMFSSES